LCVHFVLLVLVCLLIGEVFKFAASLIIPFAFVAILLESMEDVFLSKPVASEAGREGQEEI